MPRRFFQSIGYAGRGIKHAYWTQRNIRIHILIALLVTLAGLFLKISPFELVAVLITISFVIMSEMINTAIEEIVNMVSPGHRHEASIAKDVAAGAVLFSAFCAIIVGCLIFIPHLIFR